MGPSAYGIMTKGSSKEHHFSKQVVEWAQTQGIKPAARKWGIARNTIKTWLKRLKRRVIRGKVTLLGAVTNNLRAINIIVSKNKILLNFYYEKIESFEEELSDIVASEMLTYFEDQFEIESKNISLKKDILIPEEGIRIFSRHENS